MSGLPSGWAIAPLVDIAAVIRGVTYDKRQAASQRRPGYLPILRATNINQALDLNSEMVYVPEERVRPAQRMVPGDIVVASSSGSARVVGKSAQLRTQWEGGFGAFCTVIRPIRGMNPQYLGHYVAGPQVRKEWRTLAQGTNINNLKASDLSGTLVPIPPAAEQERIVAAIEEQFSRLDAGVAALERVRQNLKRMRASVLQSAITGRLLGGLGAWEQRPLGDLIADIHSGKSFKCDERPALPDEWGVVKVSAMTWGEFRESENKTVLPGRDIDGRLEIRPGDVLLSRSNTVGYVGAVVRVGHCRPKLLLSDKSLRIVPSPELTAEWLVISLRSEPARRYIEAVATGTSDSMRNISQPKIRALRIPVPTPNEQRRVATEVDRQLAILTALEGTLEVLSRRGSSCRSSILGAAFSGKLVPQDPSDEAALVLLERIATERELANGHMTTRGRKPRTTRPKVLA